MLSRLTGRSSAGMVGHGRGDCGVVLWMSCFCFSSTAIIAINIIRQRSTTIIVVMFIVVVLLCLSPPHPPLPFPCPPPSFSLCKPNRSRQMAAHLEPGSA